MSQGLGILLGSYLLGCFTAGYYFVRLRTGNDIREFSTGSVGARNVGRVVGPVGFVVTVVVDFAKGALAVWATIHLAASDWLAALAMVAVVTGHIWPLQLRLRGGKGVAPSLGALLIYDYGLALVGVGLFAGMFALLRRTILSGLLAFAFTPLVSIVMGRQLPTVVGISALVGLVLIAHRKNLVEEIADLAGRGHVQSKRGRPPR